MSYGNGNRGHGYGNQPKRRSFGFGKSRGRDKGVRQDTKTARKAFEKRSERSQIQDLIKLAPFAPSLEVYLKYPEKYDFPNVDTPDPHLIMSHKTPRERAADLAKCASKAPVEVWVKDTSEHDLEGVDTPNSKNKANILAKIKQFKIVKKDEKKVEVEKALAKVEEKVKVELAKAETAPEPTENKRQLPSVDEIYAEAVKMWQLENNKPGDLMEGVANPTRGELREEGLLNAAKLRLMTSQDGVAERKTFDYVENLRQELNKIGFDVIPISGFDSSDLHF